MPNPIVPGIYVPEIGSPTKSITGVGTTATAFVGPTRFGPVKLAPQPLSGMADFERIYGGEADLGFTPALNFLAQSVRAFFNEGGTQLYVARVAGKSKSAAGTPLVPGKTSRFIARFPGAAGNGQIKVQVANPPASVAIASMAVDGSLLRIKSSPPVLLVKQKNAWLTSDAQVHALTAADEATGLELLLVQFTAVDADGHSVIYADLGLDRRHPRYLGTVLKQHPSDPADEFTQPFAFEVGSTVTAFELFPALAPDANGNATVLTLTGGTDVAPTLADYKQAFALLAALPDVSIVAAPGHTAFPAKLATGIADQLVAHAEQMLDRVAVLDSPAGLDLPGVQTYKGRFNSSFAALYYPWILVSNPGFDPSMPGSAIQLALPPSGFICGIYARNDLTRGVFKAPANEAIQSATGLERALSDADQAVLNPVGINCLRAFPGKGCLVWGARTTGSDLQWQYVNVRRYFIYLERSIQLGTQWAVFEPNGAPLWTAVATAVETFLTAEWHSGALMGTTPAEAFFVRCDQSTMTQSDLDNGQLVCLVGVAAVRPTEFIIFRITQLTAAAH